MTIEMVRDILAGALLLSGSFFVFAAGLGVARFGTLLGRMHAATKPQVLGLILLLAGVGLRLGSWSAAGMLLLVVIFQLMTAPVAAHMVGRAGFRTGKVDTSQLVVDDLTTDEVLSTDDDAGADRALTDAEARAAGGNAEESADSASPDSPK